MAAVALLLPLIARPFVDGLVWGPMDFAIMGLLLLSACLAWEFVGRGGGSLSYRRGMAVAVVTALLLIWITLAVGIIGAENDPANAMYGVVLAVLVIGALAARLQPRGMARALVFTALAQMLAGLVALVAGWGSTTPSGTGAVAVLTLIFSLLWLASAWLFRRAGQEALTLQGPTTSL
jgi:hypothetical protein